MCIEDIAVSRRCNAIRHTVDAGATLILPANQQRLSLIGIVDGDSSCRLLISTQESDTANNYGLVSYWANVVATTDVFFTNTVIMDFRTHPGVIHGILYVRAVASVAALLEVVANNDLQAEVDSYLKKHRMSSSA